MPPAAFDAAPAAVKILTVAETRRAWAAKFRAAGFDSAELDARLLIGHALALDHAGLAAASERKLAAGEATAIAALARRRLLHEPVARILGRKEFWGLSLSLEPSTLVPRPDTETIVEAALTVVAERGAYRQALRIADLGTGSGAILLALLSELPNAFGVGTDLSSRALAVARDNARRHRLTRATFAMSDMAAALRGPFDIIVSNPPYIPSADIATLPPEVRSFDPRLALDGGADGLDAYRTIAAAAPGLLSPDGIVVVELGAGQAQPVANLFAAAGLAPAKPRPDLNGVPRALVAEKLQQNGHEK